MPWCENVECGKRDLKKDQVVFDDRHQKVLCIPCGQQAAQEDPVVMGEVVEKTFFGLHYTSDQGFHAELVHRGVRLDLRASNEQISQALNSLGQRYLG